MKKVKLTRNKICYDLKNTPYKLNHNHMILHFSSMKNMEKFHERFKEHRITIRNSLKKRFKININTNILADVILYRSIEKRGFHITLMNGDDLSCEKDVVLGGLKIKKKD